MDDAEVERRVQELRLTAPRVTLESIHALVVGETYTVMPSGKTMVCELTLKNGFTVRGEASVVSRANFNEELGRQLSRDDAMDKIWQLEGYALQQKLYDDAVADSKSLLP